ncbi:MAG: hypothetical protein KAI24_12650 [Planctomycetes bacterium]|nr:hypothetical protein [Planctomycetota bacterium]
MATSLFAVLPASAQDDVLAVERRSDLRGHARLVRALHERRVSLTATEMSARELCRFLTASVGEATTFHCRSSHADAAPKLDLELRATPLWSLMSIAQMETRLRFVYRFGVVFLVPADDIRPWTHLEIYDLRGMVATLRQFPGPELGLGIDRSERPLFPEPIETEQTVSGFTADGIEQLLRESVRPESWERDGVKLINQGGLFLIRQSPQVHDEIELLLARVGLMAPSRRLLRRRGLR